MKSTEVIARGNDYVFNEIDGEVVMMNIETGAYASMNATGKSIWNLLEQSVSIDAVINALVSEYNVSKQQCEKDIIPFIEKMIAQKIVVKID